MMVIIIGRLGYNIMAVANSERFFLISITTPLVLIQDFPSTKRTAHAM
jgi:hypothetical protein